RERFRILEAELSARLSGARAPRKDVRYAVAALDRPGADVGDVTGRTGLSRRRFIEVFTAEVGMTPKRFARVRRFQRALALARRTSSPDWARLALVAGYFDQSH